MALYVCHVPQVMYYMRRYSVLLVFTVVGFQDCRKHVPRYPVNDALYVRIEVSVRLYVCI